MGHEDRMEERLREWATWIGGGRRGHGYPAVSVLHPSWLPPAPGQTPTLRSVKGGDSAQRATHAAIGALSVRLANTVVVHYVLKLPLAEQAMRLQCAESTVYARLAEAKRQIAGTLAGGVRAAGTSYSH